MSDNDASMAIAAAGEDPSILQEKMINEEYKIWKKNAPYLYDLVVTHALEWPSLTCQWFPDVERPAGKDYKMQRLLLGTHTSDEEPNYLQIATVQLPLQAAELDSKRFDEERGEFGGYGGTQCRITVVQKIPHAGEVNRARYMPQNPCVIATKTVSGEVHIFDYTKHPSMPAPDAIVNPDLRLVGQSGEGYGLAWSPLDKGFILSSSADSTVCLWDVKEGGRDRKELSPLTVFRRHSAFVEDVALSPGDDNVFASLGDDRLLVI